MILIFSYTICRFSSQTPKLSSNSSLYGLLIVSCFDCNPLSYKYCLINNFGKNKWESLASYFHRKIIQKKKLLWCKCCSSSKQVVKVQLQIQCNINVQLILIYLSTWNFKTYLERQNSKFFIICSMEAPKNLGIKDTWKLRGTWEFKSN